MDPAVNKRDRASRVPSGPWGPLDRPVYHYPFGDYVYRSVSGYGQEAESGYGLGSVLFGAFVGGLIGYIVGENVEKRQK